ncbi:hypothetical protein [Bacillus paranthracis]|uniref:hypothetical protein n=1 Tax=Bacillus paranthracis TaxID=2026186 RepID=UPI00132EB6D0|nr:hypothetical protein FPL02_14880 [Bacillus paranthracis]
MPCVLPGLTQPVCLTIVYNILSGTLISSSINCRECEQEIGFDYMSKNLTIKMPFTVEGSITFNDKFLASCITTNITQP